MKVCKKCLIEMPIDRFYKHNRMSDGYLNFCKLCINEKAKIYRSNNSEEIKRKNRLRFRKRNVEYERSYRKTEKKRQSVLNWQERNKQKRAVHILVGNLLRDGKIKKLSCEICGDINTQAHHDDYTKPLLINWLCPKHHGQRHKQLNEIKRTCEQS